MLNHLRNNIIAVLLFSLSSFASTLTGTIKDSSGQPFNGSITFLLNASAINSSTHEVVIPTPISTTVSNGQLPSSFSSIGLTGNDLLLPTRTQYYASYYDPTGRPLSVVLYYISGASYDLGSAIPTPITTQNISYMDLLGIRQITAKNIGGVRYANQFASTSATTSALQIQAACSDAGVNGVVIASFGMASGDPTTLTSGCFVYDYRSGANLRIFVGTGATIREVSSYATNISADNPFGRFQVYSEIGTTPNTNGIPLGNDLVVLARASADVHSKNVALDTTSTTTVAAPGSVTVTVGSTTNMYTAASIVIDPGGTNEETITTGNWSKPSGTSITATFALTHAQPYTIRQIGGFFIDTGLIKITGDGKHLYTSFVEGNNNTVFQYPTSTGSAWPDAGFKWGAVETGFNGTNHDRISRNYSTASAFQHVNFANTAALFSVTETSASAKLTLGNPTNSPTKELALADARRSYGGGTGGAYVVYPQQGGAGTNGIWKVNNNDIDDTTSLTVTTSTQTTAAVKLAVGGGTTMAKYYVVSGAIAPVLTAANSCVEQPFTPAAFNGVISASDNIYITSSATMAANGVFPVLGVRAIANGVAITYCNPTAGGLTAPGVTITVTGTR